ncbi:28S ribosomal protein S10, mitochondrial [Parelaphostrongylus tenuis]|uniref:Small ribosomal subunit protein uS10m n=1 Tax=Parelaphostrongylus tenuis TaxID=148309 RepID=A0AAD5QG42_PARTN|nr:28S ribosomal protein S10, mitochondrial [Parelaphostrongylus tenuis]
MYASVFVGIQNAVRTLTLTSSRTVRSVPRTMPSVMTTPSEAPMPDKLFSSIELEYRGHDPEVLKSYTNVCNHLNLTRGRFEVFPYVRWIQPALRSKFVHKKYKLHYETRTHITVFEVRNLTGSTASTFLEYIERNIPEGVGMRVDYVEMQPLPPTISPTEKAS